MDWDEKDVERIMGTMEERQNPFDLDTVPDMLINIATGQLASDRVSKELSERGIH